MNSLAESLLSRSLFAPLLLVVFALFLQTMNATFDLLRARDSLIVQRATQERPIAEAQKVRAQLESISSDVAKLAEQGNLNAIRLRDTLRQQGVKLKAPSDSSAAQ
jgi:hypothetical protein